ncbi:hypothetical protein HO173_001427 [Letharia columbiana]|uniref:HECT-type E3 ubiquitin transferase n=1 Tax=Letharia columbiana TaxID=112416 RepID=A0A8H6G535_9LECA|nr:uncharacterized protein HO173_001427 [Letharia columbiana]KAF6240754.1 hypothetical protein HO173_001427 [Letharia columbiana]
MGRIKKEAGPKHDETLPPAIAEFVSTASILPISQLPRHFRSFPIRWAFPKGDVYHWIPLFNRFDNILEQFVREYGLNVGPQVRPFGCVLLLQGVAEENEAAKGTPTNDAELKKLGFGPDGDRQLVEDMLNFSRKLLENCGNRSLYASSERLGDLLNTTSLSLLSATLQLAARLAHRYYASRQKGAQTSQHLNNSLLQLHYNIDLEKMQKLANPFTKSSSSASASANSATPIVKGKEKGHASKATSSVSVNANDLSTLTQDVKTSVNGSAKYAPTAEKIAHHSSSWEDWGSVLLTYYQSATVPNDDQKPPPTPTPTRRPSGLSRPSRLSSSDESPEASTALSNAKSEEPTVGGMRQVEIPYSQIASSQVEDVLNDGLQNLPKDSHYELLTRIRNAKAIATSVSMRQELVKIRLLAITNLAYIYPDVMFQQKILQQDSDQPRRFQIAYQLADLVHPPGNETSGIPLKLQTVALGTLEALAKQKTKAPDVCAALNVNVNHGVLFYLLRKAVAEMASEEPESDESEERREAVFSLLECLPPSAPRTGENLIAAGLLDILIEILGLRTNKAERSQPKILSFLNAIVYTVRDALQSIANSKGLDTISDLIAYEVRSSLERAKNGEGLNPGYRSHVVDYQTPFFQQQTLRMLFKLINHLMANSPANFDRLLRNLIDSPQLLAGLKIVITNPKVFGSSIWSGAINIMSSFIHNEPTSYAVISEAGLSSGLLDAITLNSKPQSPMTIYELYISKDEVIRQGVAHANAGGIAKFMKDDHCKELRQAVYPSTHEILPASDSITAVPQAFGAICLHNTGLELFQKSGAIDSFFRIFESDEHIKVMLSPTESELLRMLGNSFDELVRHHPTLKMAVVINIMTMIERVGEMCKSRAKTKGCGAKLWLQAGNGKLVPAGEHQSTKQSTTVEPKVENDDDVVMGEASPIREEYPVTAVLDPEAMDEMDEKNGPSTAQRIEVVMRFLEGFFENSSLCSFFVEANGANLILDLATLPSLPFDFNMQKGGEEVSKVVHIMVEQKPHLVLPTLLQRAQKTLDDLQPLYNYTGKYAFFSEFTSVAEGPTNDQNEGPYAPIGTTVLKSLVNVHTLTCILSEVFSAPIFGSRSSQTPFSQVNLADKYRNVVTSLGLLHRVCVWEEILLLKRLPDAWKMGTSFKGFGMGSEEADAVFGFLNNGNEIPGDVETTSAPSRATAPGLPSSNARSSDSKKPKSPSMEKDEKTAHFKNVRSLRYVLSQIPSAVVLFFQNLGKSLVAKRRPEAYARQNAYLVAEAMSNASLEQLRYEPAKKSACAEDRYAYWVVVLTSVSTLIIEGSSTDRPSAQVLTLLLQAFTNDGGLKAFKEVLETFFEAAKTLIKSTDETDRKARIIPIAGGIRIILSFFAQITMSKSITESNQTHAITSHERDRGQLTYFLPSQFLVELRMTILPVVKRMWDSDFVDKADVSIIKCLIEILRTVLEGSDEQGAFKRGDQQPAPRKAPIKVYSIHSDKVRSLTDLGYDPEIVQEALYRCQNTQILAIEYCQALRHFPGAARNPIPEYDQEKARRPVTATPQRSESGATLPAPDPAAPSEATDATDRRFAGFEMDPETMNEILAQAGNGTLSQEQPQAPMPAAPAADTRTGDYTAAQGDTHVEVEEADGEDSASSLRAPPPPAPGVPPETDSNSNDNMAMSNDSLRSILSEIPGRPTPLEMPERGGTMTGTQRPDEQPQSRPVPTAPESPKAPDPVTVNDLDDGRATVRENLIDRALDVLNVHDDVTFELADLIQAAALKSLDAKQLRSEIGETLVQSLISLQMEEDFRPAGKRIASYANLLALVLQDKSFFEATTEFLIENLEQLMGFIKIYSDPPEQASPWIGQILLVIEKVLAEDVQPSKIEWSIPASGEIPKGAIIDMPPPLVSLDAKLQLFEAIDGILLGIGRDESLALSVVRVLVILTRNREIASKLGEKRKIDRLFIMIKLLTGMTIDRLPSTFMLLLRHIVEDEATVRQIMRSEIMFRFETRTGRATDTQSYVKQMYDLILRSPEIFVEVTNEKLEIPRYDSSQQPQILGLKPELKEPEEKETQSTRDLTAAKPSEDVVGEVEGQKEESKPLNGEDEQNQAQKPRATETKAPIVEHPSGVIHYLLSQLLAYREVPDPPDPQLAKPQEPLTEASSETLDIADSAITSPASGPSASSPASTANANSNDTKKAEKPEFKPEQHPIYVYRCFLLQCLAELLHCYNRTKIEFINFSRKADPKAMTPSKPRSAILNYLLNDVIPVGTLSHEDTIEYRKKNLTSNWAMSAIVSLCLRTNENGYPNKRDAVDEDDEPDLLFVRKFVLEHALKAYRDANASEEHPDVKYARLLDLADLFNRLLMGRLVPASGTPSPGVEGGFQKSIAKIMFEKNFIAALTGSIADIDLNFPPAKRAIKYILRPLKQLTATAIVLSESSSISSIPGTTDEDEISSATSVSDMDDDREETPDLFRHSTLGMFEPGRDQESSSESSEGDEEMYDDEYEEGLEYEEGMERDDEVISDEDEDLGEAGPIEGLHGDPGMDVEVVIDAEDDEPSDDDEDQDDSEDMDEDNEMEVIDEITGDSENASLAEGEDEDWQDEDGEDIARYNEENDLDRGFSQDTQDAESAVRDIVREFGGPEAALQRLEGLEDGPGGLAMDLEEGIGGRYMDDVVGHEHDEEDEDDEDENEDEDEDVMFQPEYDDEEPGMPEPPFGWDPDDDPGLPLPRGHHHHHHHPRRMPDLWSSFPGSLNDPRTHLTHLSSYRSHRPAGVPRSNDDNSNPLLQRSVAPEPSRGTRGQRSADLSDAAANFDDYWVHGMEPGRRPRGMISADSPVSFLNSLIASVGRRGDIGGMGFSAVGGPGGAVQISIGGGAVGSALTLPRDIENLLGGVRGHAHHEASRVNREGNPQQAVVSPAVTYQRWQEESRLLFGNTHIEKAMRITEHLLRILVPPAVEKKKREDEESKRRAEEERQDREKLREERLALEKAEREMKEQQENAEREAREAAAAQAASGAEVAPPEGQESGLTEDEGAMEGVENAQVEEPAEIAENAEGPTSVEEPAAAGPSEPTERVRTTIRGRELDITGLGIDMAYLDALPEEIREEVLMSQLAIQRSEAAAAGEEPTDISREFLEALPPEIREELLQQEAQDRRRREREEARRRQQAASGGGSARAEEMDPASFFASLDPALRQNVLMEQDEEILAQLPEEIAAEARALGGNRPMHRFAGIAGRGGRANGLVRQILDGRPPQPAAKKPPRKQIVQMLDKAGVATLLRLMFVPQQGSSRQSLNGILHDVSRNRQNRAEVISLLLSILQDGSTDVNAIERSFTHLSLRAKQPITPKTPQPLKRTLTGPMASVASNMEATPLMVIQQCLSALVSLTQYNPHIPAFFLEEHEVTSGMKTKANRKGKAKENKASKFALNALLSLLDRKLIMESSGCMEQLSSLLQSVTNPLTMLLRKDKDKPEEPKAVGAPREPTNGSEGVIADHAVQDLAQTAEPSIEESTSPMMDVQADGETRQETSAGPTAGQAKEKEMKKPTDEMTKKARDLTPPIVPEENLRLVVNILAARECSAKTFRDTLSTINNLSGIPGAKEVFGKGLIEQAQDLGHSILQDLDELVPQIKQATSGTDIQGMALTKFSPASSDQAKLLRVLTALDYLFDHKHIGGKTTSAVDSEGESAESSTPKEDLLTMLYENPTFGSLWNKLSECLNSIRQGDGSLNVATILLPLIEALMVVCKNTTLKDIPVIKAAKEFAITSPPPESFMESLFFKFTEDHRKILNDLVRHNPKLMSGTFSLLVKNPKVLEFDNKRNYFTRRLHSRGTEARHPQPPLQLSVRRDQVFLDSFKNLSYKTGDEIKYGKLSIRFHGEEGVDAGGVTREWFQVLSRQMFNPDYALFIPVASDRTTFHPNKLSKVNEEHLMFFKFIGRIIGKALYEGRALDCHFSRAVYKRMLGKTVSIKDMETLDLDYYKSLLWMLENDITEIITETFSVETDDFGVTEVVDLTEKGRNIPVTEENKHEYVQLVVEYRLTGSVQAQLEMFLQGFHDIVPPELIAIFNEQELELLISGLPDIDVDDWKNHTEYHNYQASSPQIQWFWRAVRSFDKEERAKLLQFVTGTSKVPLNGFGQLEGMNGFSRFNIHRDYGNKDRLPSSHTCFNQLDLPEYESYEALRQQVYTAMTAGSEYFGFA